VEEVFLAKDSSQLKFVPELSERRVGDLCWDLVTKRYLMTADKSSDPKFDNDPPFPPNTLDSVVFRRSGRKKDKPIFFAKVPDMKIQAVWR
jgi:hypothetical protein